MIVFKRTMNPQFRNIRVGMFSGPRPSYQRYSLGANAAEALNRTGV